MEKLWTAAETARYLGISEADLERLVNDGRLTGYKLAGQFMRFKPSEVKVLKQSGMPAISRASSERPSSEASRWVNEAREFIYFYDFYLLAVVILGVVVIYLISSG